ncbi:MAG TPA: permease prefix domain 1-containing protein [Acidimicrobiia bacterium]|nr:permease prefix domain 1-containing protein [Acidimicrobiia bacterium]
MSDLTDRYVAATLRTIPVGQREDIEAELRASIDDAVEAQVAGGADETSAEEAVLVGLGDPDKLASGYTGRPGYLIGPDHFFAYRRLLAVLLVTVVPIVLAVTMVGQVIAGSDLADVLASTIGVGLSLVVHVVFWTTLVFYFIDRSDEATGTEWSLSMLPSLPTVGSIKLSDTIASVVFLVITMALIVVSRDISPVTAADGTTVPIFDPAMWDFWFPFLVAVLGVEIVFEIVKYRTGSWTWGLASVNLAINALFAVPVVYLLATEQVFSTAFLAVLPEQLLRLDWVLILVIVLITLFDVVQGFRKAYLAS